MPFVPELAWPSLAFLIASAAAFVAFDLARRLQTTGEREARAWLAAAGVALGTGLWAAPVIAGASPLAASGGAAQPWVAFGAWAMALVLSVAVLAQAGGGVIGARRIALAAGLVGIGLPALQLALLAALGVWFGAAVQWPLLALAPVTAAAGGAAALGLFFMGRQRFEPYRMTCAAVSACLLAGTVVLVHGLTVQAMAPAAPSAGGDALGPLLTAALAALATAALLAGLHVGAARLERRRLAQVSASHDLRKLALRDPLTGLANRVMFEGALNQAVQHADAHGTRLALLFIDLDGFGPVNQALGHHNGDRVLREAAARLRAAAGAHDRLARLGADKFLILRTDDPGTDAAAHLAGEVLERLQQPFTLPDRDATFSASIGIAMYPEHGAMSTLLTHAEAALRGAKATGGATYCFSIDDFGTGYSSLSTLRKLPAEELKIDRSFVLDLETSSDARAVAEAEAVIKLAQVLGLKVVAEGVETEGQNQILRALGCDELQGYLFAKPMSAKALAVWAMDDVGPRSLAFRASLYKDTVPFALH
jgi:diguanylate cyclase